MIDTQVLDHAIKYPERCHLCVHDKLEEGESCECKGEHVIDIDKAITLTDSLYHLR